MGLVNADKLEALTDVLVVSCTDTMMDNSYIRDGNTHEGVHVNAEIEAQSDI